MKELMVFEGNNVEMVSDDNKLLFELYSTGIALGQVKYAKGIAYPRKDRIDENVKNAGITLVVRNGQRYLTEETLYDLMLEMKTDKVKPFRKWITSDVLPSIRKTGSYSMVKKQDSYLIEDRIERAKRWIEEAEYTRSLEVKNAELDADNKKLKPAATYAVDVLNHNKNLTSIDAVGRELGLNKNSMHKLLRDVGILRKCGSKYVLGAGHENLGKGQREFFLEKTYNQKGKTYSIPNDLAVSEKGRGYIMKHFDEWKVQAYGDKWREELWSKARLAEYHKSVGDI